MLAFLAHQDIQDLADIQAAVFLDIQDSVEFLEPLAHKVHQDFLDSVDILVLVFQAHLDILVLVDILDQVYLDILDLVAQADFLVQQDHKAYQVILDIQEFLEPLGHRVYLDIQDTQALVVILDQE